MCTISAPHVLPPYLFHMFEDTFAEKFLQLWNRVQMSKADGLALHGIRFSWRWMGWKWVGNKRKVVESRIGRAVPLKWCISMVYATHYEFPLATSHCSDMCPSQTPKCPIPLQKHITFFNTLRDLQRFYRIIFCVKLHRKRLVKLVSFEL